MQKKKPCSECRRWFYPNPRVGDRQKTCGTRLCKQRRHQRMDRAWHARHPEYDAERRWSARVAKAKAAGVAKTSLPGPLRSGLPLVVVQDAMGPEAAEIIGQIARLGQRVAQDAIEAQVVAIKEQIALLAPAGPQDAIAAEPRSRPP